MKVSIITPFVVPNRKVLNMLKSCKKQTYKNIEILAVSEKTDLKMDGIKSIYVPHEKDVGKKRNIGAKEAKGEILFFVDCDCVLMPDTVQKLVEIFKEKGTDAVTGKPIAPIKGKILGIVTGWEYEDRFDEMGENFVDVAATTCLGVKRSAFLDIGGFDVYSEKDLAVGEDWDFSVRFRKRGYKIFHTNKVIVIHDHGDETLRHWLKRRIQHSKYRIVHLKKYGKSFDQYSSFRMMVESTIFLSVPIMFRILKKRRDFRVFILPFFAFLRNIAWSIGVISGFIEFRRRSIISSK
ncbi:MAG: glycosyltransferase [Candidatus Aenigmatarchaeota archaeon]